MNQSLKEILDNNGTSDEHFLKAVYRAILHRDFDLNGREYYLGKLASGQTRLSIVREIIYSQEARQKGVAIPDFLQKRNKSKKSAFFKKLDGFVFEHFSPSMHQNYLKAKDLSYQSYEKLIKNKELPINANINVKHEENYINPQSVNNNLSITSVDGLVILPSERENQIWFDLTTSFEWQQGIVGIVRAELQVAKELKLQHPDLKFFMHYGNGFVEIDSEQLNWLLEADSVADAYLKFFKRKNFADIPDEKGTINLNVPKSSNFYHPFKPFDIIFSMGWMDSQKEKYFSTLKEQCRNVYLSYLVYDTILINDSTKQYYHPIGSEKFRQYVEWISYNCDYIFFGGETAKNDLLRIQDEHGWPKKPGRAIKFGSNSLKNVSNDQCESVLKNLGIHRDFIIAVGSIEPRKNYDTLYRAYLRALEKSKSNKVPMLIICGSDIGGSEDLVDSLQRNPLLKENVIKISPNEIELAVLYKKCLFTVLPSVYEGWSLTLPESLGQGKFCLCSDTPPLREIGEGLVDFLDKFNVEQWADKIIYYAANHNEIRKKEKAIQKKWRNISWSNTASTIIEGLIVFPLELNQVLQKEQSNSHATTWVDLTLSFLNWNGGLSGIVRTELAYARYLYALDNNTRFFAFQAGENGGYFFEITHDYLAWLFNDLDLSQAYKNFRDFWNAAEMSAGVFRNPLLNSGLEKRDVRIDCFPPNSRIFFAGIDNGLDNGKFSAIKTLSRMKNRNSQSIFQIVYDFTPILFPHLHLESTCNNYNLFLKIVYEYADFIIYGGRTAQIDGNAVRESRGWKNPSSDFIEFGSDIKGAVAHSEDDVTNVLNKYGLKKNEYILTVGTIEPRKNHEMLYRAYEIKFLENKLEEMPTLFIAGKAGWKTTNFLEIAKRDARFEGKIIIDSPTDQELDVLYQNCAFTVLPTFYEGWSLTLPESLSYGKMCITSDAAPLKEVGREMIPYINPLDTQRWSDQILDFFKNPTKVANFESKIRDGWQPKTWLDSARELKSKIEAYHQGKHND